MLVVGPLFSEFRVELDCVVMRPRGRLQPKRRALSLDAGAAFELRVPTDLSDSDQGKNGRVVAFDKFDAPGAEASRTQACT